MEGYYGDTDGDLYDGTVEDSPQAQDFRYGGDAGTEGYCVFSGNQGYYY